MTTRRERKHARIAVTGDIPLDSRIPRWESELLRAALDRVASPQPNPPAPTEVSDAASS